MKKTLLITGASSDIALATMKYLGEHDKENQYHILAHFHGNDKRILEVLETYSNLSGESLQADLSNKEEVKNFIEEVMHKGPIQQFFHVPALPFDYMRYKQLDTDYIRKELEVSLLSFLEISKNLFPVMKKEETARALVMLTSFVTEEMPPKFMVDYITTKYALLGAMKAAATEFGGGTLCINGISPEMMETKFLRNMDPRILEMNAAKRESGKLLSPDEVAPIVCEMLSERCTENGVNRLV